MSARQLEKTYQPHIVEERWGQFWIEEGHFQAKSDSSLTTYAIVIPPPNVTGSLHIGHALNTILQDILIRWKRMQGYNTLWIPGTDHAGIATQNVVERQLRFEGNSREQIGREAFVQRVWEWKQQSGDTILEQLKKLGASCDWSRLRFTLDDGLSQAVNEVFVQLYEEGLIYRGERLINWCPRCMTALSDIEVEHEQVSGKLYHIRYPLKDHLQQGLIVATTRPETMLGDTAVGVHPEDPRFKRHVGQQIQLPLTSRFIPIVGDAILVDPEFGTGAVKITPAHDFNDFEAGERHHLPRLSLLDPHGQMAIDLLRVAQVNPRLAEQLSRKPIQQARSIVVDRLREEGFLLKIEDHKMALGMCYRCKTVVEPYLSPQWFVKIRPLADPAIQAVETDRIRIVPEGWKNNYLGWMRNIKDWCISRQIWWGHQIPAWYCQTCNEDRLNPTNHREYQIEDTPDITDSHHHDGFIPSNARPIVSKVNPKECPHCHGSNLLQDPDVLDTWFSSALWPFSTLGWPEKTQDFDTFYPTSTLVTGLDILFFWVARMIMMGLKFTGDIPFRDVYIHALVRDAEGQKMSKSKGNVIDPLTKMGQYGTDALRFTLTSMASPGRDIKLAEERIEGYRNFVTKIWNAARFILMHAEGPSKITFDSPRNFADRWILSRLNDTIRHCAASLEAYRFDQAASHIYQFLWHEYCDWYIELSKLTLQEQDTSSAGWTRHTLLESFEIIQRLLHPMMPFLTEELWQALPHEGNSIVTQPFPTPKTEWDAPDTETAFQAMEQFVNTARNSRILLNCPPAQPMTLFGTTSNYEELQNLHLTHHHMEHLTRSTIRLTEQDDWPSDNILRLVVGTMTVGTRVNGDIDLNKALDRIKKQLQEKQKESKRLEGRLASKDFIAKAEPSVVQESKERLQSLTQEMILLSSSETQLQAMVKK